MLIYKKNIGNIRSYENGISLFQLGRALVLKLSIFDKLLNSKTLKAEKFNPSVFLIGLRMPGQCPGS